MRLKMFGRGMKLREGLTSSRGTCAVESSLDWHQTSQVARETVCSLEGGYRWSAVTQLDDLNCCIRSNQDSQAQAQPLLLIKVPMKLSSLLSHAFATAMFRLAAALL